MLLAEDISLLAVLLPTCHHRCFIVRIPRVLRLARDLQRRPDILLLGRNYIILHNPTPSYWCREWRSCRTKVVLIFTESFVIPSERERANDDKRTLLPALVRWLRAIKYKVHYETGSWPRHWLMEMNSAERRTRFRRPKDRKRRFFLCTKGLMILLPVTRRRSLLSLNNLQRGFFRVTCWEDGAGMEVERAGSRGGETVYHVLAFKPVVIIAFISYNSSEFAHFLISFHF